ncbi:MAG: VWA domain-containing protein [Phycisphaerales bacterium]|nr:VWA domain-containing protein [Phycisphaerales bacterium]
MWLTPLIAGVAAAITIPSLIILYFLKLRRRDVEISTTLLWKKTIQDMQANAPFQKLRRNILLLLQLLILIAAILAIAQPEVRSDAPLPTRSVIVIDRSASMAALDEVDENNRPISRLEKARREALNYVDLMDSGETRDKVREAMVIAFDRHATVIQTFTSDKDKLRRAIEGIRPSDGVSQVTEAIKLANAQEAKAQENVGLVTVPIFMWSDGALQDVDDVTLLGDTRLEYNAVGRNGTANVAIVSLQAERAYDRPDEATLFVGLMSTDLQPREAFVEIAVDGLRAGAGSVQLPAADPEEGPAYASFVFPLQRDESAVITATVTTEDALAADNSARMILPPAQQVSVGFVTEGHLFLKYALEALRVSRIVQMTPAEFEQRARRGQNAEFDVFILDRWVPEAAPPPPDDLDAPVEPFEPTLPPGQYLIFKAIPNLRGLYTGPPVAESAYSVLDWRRGDPALANVSLAGLTYWKPASIVNTDDVRVLADGEHGPLIVEATHDAVRAIVVGFDITETDWYLKPEWVLFLGTAIRELGRGLGGSTIADARPGGTLATRLPTGVSEATLILPDGDRVTLYPSEDGQVHYGPLDRVGFYRLQWNGPAGSTDVVSGSRVERAIPVNLLDANESRLDVRPALTFKTGAIQAVSTAAGDARYSTRRLWPWLIAAALGIVMLEWFVYNRKVHL